MLEMKGRERVEAGGLTFIVQHELWDGNIQDHADQGIVILVTKDVDGKETSLLKFNCFDIEKSYIYGPENANIASDGPMMLGDTGTTGTPGKMYRLDPIVDNNAIGWTINTLEKKLPAMLERAGYPEVAANIDLEEVILALPRVEFIARELFASKRYVVKHNRGTDVFEAGNIRFGLEMRRLPIGDGGLAVHVLTDLAGTTEKSYVEETEILAFDCFWDGPHYHYGPRNKNLRIYWDKTLIEDPLGWVFQQLDRHKLGAMIDRAGYPGVAADLDDDKLEAVIPEMAKRAREMQAKGTDLTGHPGLPLDVTPNLVPN